MIIDQNDIMDDDSENNNNNNNNNINTNIMTGNDVKPRNKLLQPGMRTSISHNSASNLQKFAVSIDKSVTTTAASNPTLVKSFSSSSVLNKINKSSSSASLSSSSQSALPLNVYPTTFQSLFVSLTLIIITTG